MFNIILILILFIIVIFSILVFILNFLILKNEIEFSEKIEIKIVLLLIISGLLAIVLTLMLVIVHYLFIIAILSALVFIRNFLRLASTEHFTATSGIKVLSYIVGSLVVTVITLISIFILR